MKSKYYILVYLLILLFFVFLIFLKNRKEQNIKSDYKFSIGKIIKYSDDTGSDASGRNITYLYNVGKKTYRRTIKSGFFIDDCIYIKNAECQKKRYWVIYSKTHPEKSLIDLNVEIHDLKNLKLPTDLSHFK
jgi:hypothetical protein